MRPHIHPLLAAALVALATGTVAHASSERTQQALRDRLPKFDARSAEAAREAAARRAERRAAEAAARTAEARIETNAAGEEVVVMPEVEVRERKLAQPSADDWLSNAEVTKKAVRLHAAEMNALETALNRWHIPFLTPSFANRARASYEERKRAAEMERLDHLNKVGELSARK